MTVALLWLFNYCPFKRTGLSEGSRFCHLLVCVSRWSPLWFGCKWGITVGLERLSEEGKLASDSVVNTWIVHFRITDSCPLISTIYNTYVYIRGRVRGRRDEPTHRMIFYENLSNRGAAAALTLMHGIFMIDKLVFFFLPTSSACSNIAVFFFPRRYYFSTTP